MGTKIQANAFMREYRSMIDLDGATSNGMRSIYHENEILKNGRNMDSFLSYDLEKVRQTILEHESVFKNQLQELHRLYKRQQELMNDIKMNKDNVKDHSSYLFSSITPQDARRACKFFPGVVQDKSAPVFPPTQDERSFRSRESWLLNSTIFPHLGLPADVYSSNTEKHMQERFSKLPIVESTYDKKNHQTSQHKADDSTYNIYFKMNNNPGDIIRDRLELARGDIYANSCSNFNLTTKDFFQSSLRESSPSMMGLRNEMSRKEHLSDDYAEKRRFEEHCSVGDSTSGKSLFAEPTKEFPNLPMKKKIFGVEISVENDDLFNAASNTSSNLDPFHEDNCRVFSLESSSWIANSFTRNDELRGVNLNDGKNERSKGNAKGALPWFLRHSQVSGDLSNGTKSSYFMNLESLQNCSQNFFGSFENLKQKNEISAPVAAHDAEGQMNEVNEGISAKKALGFPISDVLIGGDCARKVDDVPSNDYLETNDAVLQKGSNNYISDLKHRIDLNLSLDEDDAPSPHSLPTAILKIASTEIDLETAAVTEPETEASPKEADGECDKIAAEAIIAISLSCMENKLVDIARSQAETTSSDSLKWFAEIVSSQCGDISMDQSRGGRGEESVPDGMDYFEFMTLKLEETKEQHYNYSPFVLNNPSDDEAGATPSKRSRRGQSRRGRQRKDFQSDILPGLVTLSRLEMTEDLQAFEELLKGSRLSNGRSTRNGRGRRRSGASSTIKTLCSAKAQKPICQLEEISLAGWGKKTRRLPRQRCSNAFLAFPVKC